MVLVRCSYEFAYAARALFVRCSYEFALTRELRDAPVCPCSKKNNNNKNKIYNNKSTTTHRLQTATEHSSKLEA